MLRLFNRALIFSFFFVGKVFQNNKKVVPLPQHAASHHHVLHDSLRVRVQHVQAVVHQHFWPKVSGGGYGCFKALNSSNNKKNRGFIFLLLAKQRLSTRHQDGIIVSVVLVKQHFDWLLVRAVVVVLARLHIFLKDLHGHQNQRRNVALGFTSPTVRTTDAADVRFETLLCAPSRRRDIQGTDTTRHEVKPVTGL